MDVDIVVPPTLSSHIKVLILGDQSQVNDVNRHLVARSRGFNAMDQE